VYQVRTGLSIHQPLRFPGQEAELFDGSQGANGFTARYYNGMRWYRPQWGRYTQVDPFGYAGSPYNLYGYVENDPLNNTDAYGLAVARDEEEGEGGAGELEGGPAAPMPGGGGAEGSTMRTGGPSAGQGCARPNLGGLSPKIVKQMGTRGWSKEDISHAFQTGKSFPAINRLRNDTPATRYVNPTTGQSVVIDNATGEVIQVGGPGFRY